MGHNLNFTKFLDVQSPFGILQRENPNHPYQSIGIDMYLPRVDDRFIDGIVERNKNCKVINIEKNDKDVITYFEVFGYRKTVMFFENGKFTINKKIQLPSGIGIEIPRGYHADLRSKSGNFGNEFTQVTGLIDCNYTYGMGFQIIPVQPDIKVELEVNQKIAQFVLVKSEEILSLNELSNTEWEEKIEIQQRRETRIDGFGHTGKFDKVENNIQ